VEDLIAEIVEVDLATKNDLKELEHRLVVKLGVMLGGMLSIAIGIIAAIIKLK